jgi:hypothetical protein
MPPAAALADDAELADGFLHDVDDEDLVYFQINVGDGDMEMLVLPRRNDGGRQAIVVDVARFRKLDGLMSSLRTAGLLVEPPERDRLLPLVCATHPHHDHIAGMGAFLTAHGAAIGDFWEPGYRHPSGSFFAMMNAVDKGEFRHSQPTAGFTTHIGLVRLTVLTPGIALRNRFDTYGVDINDSSISLKVEFPASSVVQTDGSRHLHDRRLRKLILGADSLTLSWARALLDFPELHPDNSAVARELRKSQGASPLRAQLFKIPHHASKHGVSTELVEHIGPRLCLISSGSGGGRYNFPHQVAMESIREAMNAIATKPGTRHPADDELGIYSTGDGSGTIAVIIGPKRDKWRVWRFDDLPEGPVDLDAARFAPSPARARQAAG